MSAAEAILSVRHLVTGFGSDADDHRVIDDVSFDVARGRVLAIIGQCGSGKSLTALSIMRLLPPEARVCGGQVYFAGQDLMSLGEAEMRRVRGRGIAMVFQEPATALSPVHTVGWQLATALSATGRVARAGFFASRSRVRQRSRELLAKVELPEPDLILDTYPHQLSAGMRRRVLIALALSGEPDLLIADEPTTGLDATIQAQILELIGRLTRDEGKSALLITHDLSAVAELASDVVVMYAGQVVEAAPVAELFARPEHPYTRSLLADSERLARVSPDTLAGTGRGLRSVEPRATLGCRFAESCPERASAPERFPRCTLEAPTLEPESARHRSRCFYPKLDTEHDA
jgi:oligopeptide/dipeptide ABC transporter ATP-binding protein